MTELLSSWEEWLPTLLDGYLLSLQVLGLCLAIGVPIGLLLALGVSARDRYVRWPTVALVELGRGTPALVLLQFLYFGLPSTGLVLSSLLASVAALAACTAAYTSEIIRGGLESVPAGQREAGEALGLSFTDRLRYVILPQGLKVALPPLLGFALMMLQATSLCFTVALPELVSRAYSLGSTNFQYMSLFILTALMYAAVCMPASIIVFAIERRLNRNNRSSTS
ncbi:amino acid ABC transporter permease [Mesorhizobium sp. ArgA1]